MTTVGFAEITLRVEEIAFSGSGLGGEGCRLSVYLAHGGIAISFCDVRHIYVSNLEYGKFHGGTRKAILVVLNLNGARKRWLSL
jgi:hypothetical protein